LTNQGSANGRQSRSGACKMKQARQVEKRYIDREVSYFTHHVTWSYHARVIDASKIEN
jgi:hypothetical protein